MNPTRTFLFFFFSCLAANAQLQVATTTEDLRQLVEVVGGERVQVFSIAKGTQDPHEVDPKPSFIVKLRNVSLFVAHGLDLETSWVEPLIQGSRNSKIKFGQTGYFELAPLLEPIEASTGPVSRAEGDVHPLGNPHFHLDPLRLGRGALLLSERMGQFQTADRDFFKKRAEDFNKKMIAKTEEWDKRIQKTGVTEFVSFHKTFSYFAIRFKLKNTLRLEPKPGIPPTAKHLIDVVTQTKERHIKVVLIENYFDDAIKNKILGMNPELKIYHTPVSIGGSPEVTTHEQLFEGLVKSIEMATK